MKQEEPLPTRVGKSALLPVAGDDILPSMPNAQVAISFHRAVQVVLTTQMGLVMVICSALTRKHADPRMWRLQGCGHRSMLAGGVRVEAFQPAGDSRVTRCLDREPNPALRPYSPNAVVAQLNRLAEVVVTRIGSLYGP